MKPLYRSAAFILLFIAAAAVSPFAAQEPSPQDSVMELPPGCSVRPNLVYKTVGDWNGHLDLYLPADTSSPVPVVLLFHGGGWNHGQKENVQRTALTFLKYGWAVANIGYRLLKTAPAPAAVEDARCALHWLVGHADAYHIDPQNIVTTGTSAGGHLALLTGMLPGDSPFGKECASGKKFTVRAIINKYGVTDVTESLSRTRWLDGAPDKAGLAKAVSPLTYVRPGMPPVITVHGDADPTVPYQQAVRLHALLDSAGVKNVFYTVKGGKHGKFEKEENKKFGEMVKQFLGDLGLPIKPRSH